MTSRTDALSVCCPECGSVTEEPCISARGSRRKSCHEARRQMFQALREALVDWHKDAARERAA